MPTGKTCDAHAGLVPAFHALDMALAKTMDGCDATRGLTAGARLTALVAAVRAPSGVARKVVMRLKNLPRGSTDTYLKSQLVGPEPEGGPLEKLRASVVAWRAYHAHVPAQRVLVIGSGPVGLLTAATLRLSGHEVTVLEKRDPSATDAKSGAYRPRYNLIKLDFVLKKVLDSFGITTERFPSLKVRRAPTPARLAASWLCTALTSSERVAHRHRAPTPRTRRRSSIWAPRSAPRCCSTR